MNPSTGFEDNMKSCLAFICFSCCVGHSALFAQEADYGIDLRATVSAEAIYAHDLTESPRDGAPLIAGFRSVLYPTWKIGKHWSVSEPCKSFPGRILRKRFRPRAMV